ncbi:MAG TPA: molybdopterin-dependent oxidoreductase [Acidimicrobiia bacterium]|nr:molybdopterin-dependent oxidoreductase [Acidimicrobiia bacterium]
MKQLGAWFGAGHGGERYRYEDDEWFGPVSASRRPDRWVRTTCGYCSVGCGMLLGVRDGRAVAVQGDPDHPVNRGRLCPKGLTEHHTIGAEGRLLHPTVGGRRVSWDEAIDRVVGGFTRLMEEHGPDSVAVLSTGQLVTEEFYALGKLVRLGLGVRHFDGNTTLCMASAVAGYKMAFGSDGPPGCYDDFETAETVVLFGANVADCHPLLAPRLLARGGPRLVVVDPRVTKTAMVADLHLPVRPRTDIVLVNGLLHVIFAEGLADRRYLEAHASGSAELEAHVAAYPPARVEAECGVPAGAVVEAARAIGTTRTVIAWTMGVNHSVQGTETVALLCGLAAATGNIGRPGAAPFSITGQCNAMGTRESGFTASMPGYRPYDDPAARTELAALWDVPESVLPAERGQAYPDIVNAVVAGRIKGLWIIGTNPVVSFPNREVLEYGLDSLELLVVQDGFESPTTARASVVLPAAIWGEKDGTYTNSERRVSRVRAAVTPPGEARPDFDIFLAMADRLGVRDRLYPGWTAPADAFSEWRRVSAGRLCDYSGITYDRIDACGGVQWPAPADDPSVPLAGSPRLYADGVFPNPTGRVRLPLVECRPLSEPPRPEYPLVLNTGRTVEHWHTRTKTGRVTLLEDLAPEAWIEMNPADAEHLKIRTGDPIRVVSQRGSIDHIIARVTAIVRAGEVFIPFHYDEACANRLTRSEFDPISREPNYKQCAVRVEPLNPPIARGASAASAPRSRRGRSHRASPVS